MTTEETANKYQWNLPYTRKDVLDIYKEGYLQAIQDVLKLTNGEVINGVLKGMVDVEKIKEIINGMA